MFVSENWITYDSAVEDNLIRIMIRASRNIVAATILGILVVLVAYADNQPHECSIEKPLTFENWKEWKQVTSKPVLSKGHSNNWVGIYVDKLAETTYLSASSPYPVCSTVVKPIYTDARGATVLKLTIMVKMPAGYDPENADWWYGVYDATGMKAMQHGRLQDCIPCHKLAASTDYLYSKEVIEIE